MKLVPSVLLALATFGLSFAQAKDLAKAPELDLTISYYSKVLTSEGVTREARYQDNMQRRDGHVWLYRVLPKSSADAHDHETHSGKKEGAKKDSAKKNLEEGHQHFNHVLIPRHVILENNKVQLEYIDTANKIRISIPPADYGNVNFDGSWESSYFLVDPKLVKAMPQSKQVSTVPHAVWYEREKNGVFQRVLWDEQRQIPLVIENGDQANNSYRRIEIQVSNKLSKENPWRNTKAYAQKEYSDFLD